MYRPFGLMEQRPITYLLNHLWVLHVLLLVLVSHLDRRLVPKRSESPETITTTLGLSLGRKLSLSFFLSLYDFSDLFYSGMDE